jgi:hypothetical protein
VCAAHLYAFTGHSGSASRLSGWLPSSRIRGFDRFCNNDPHSPFVDRSSRTSIVVLAHAVGFFHTVNSNIARGSGERLFSSWRSLMRPKSFRGPAQWWGRGSRPHHPLVGRQRDGRRTALDTLLRPLVVPRWPLSVIYSNIHRRDEPLRLARDGASSGQRRQSSLQLAAYARAVHGFARLEGGSHDQHRVGA